MNTSDWLMSSDLMAGVISATMTKLSCGTSNANLWKPMVESTLLSVAGRMFESTLDSKWLRRAGTTDTTSGPAYIRTDEGRSAIIIMISSLIVSSVMKSKDMYGTAMKNVSSDVLGSSLVAAFLEKDMVWFAARV